ncbi:hypothetical protein Xhom_04857 [Xenorhabdus hominickii]|uniref:Uncharacterized protein n=1 Tax=Xenorhabdus hominickii TaxID=351679 RepID=A0A1V0M4C4_XENHO|nr:hypothetical protein [Xenorhabdus hominickii]PHM51659.1 hypothetical protein Xhom_04857 [Xenorhabdus hominickii]
MTPDRFKQAHYMSKISVAKMEVTIDFYFYIQKTPAISSWRLSGDDEDEKVTTWLEFFTSQQIPTGFYARYP